MECRRRHASGLLALALALPGCGPEGPADPVTAPAPPTPQATPVPTPCRPGLRRRLVAHELPSEGATPQSPLGPAC